MKAGKWKPDMEHAWVTRAEIGFGQSIYVLYVPNHSFPIGLVWGEFQGDPPKFSVAGSFTPGWVRRWGVRSRINDEIFKQCDLIITEHGSKEGGAQFLKAKKYKWSKELRFYYLQRPKRVGR